MYGIFPYSYHKNQPNVGKYTIHGSYGYRIDLVNTLGIFLCLTDLGMQKKSYLLLCLYWFHWPLDGSVLTPSIRWPKLKQNGLGIWANMWHTVIWLEVVNHCKAYHGQVMLLIGLLIGSSSTVCTVYLFSFCFLQFNRLKFIYLRRVTCRFLGGNLSDKGLRNEHLYKTHHILRQNFKNIFSVAASSFVVSICFKTRYQLKNIPKRSIRRWQHTHTPNIASCQPPPPRPRGLHPGFSVHWHGMPESCVAEGRRGVVEICRWGGFEQ